MFRGSYITTGWTFGRWRCFVGWVTADGTLLLYFFVSWILRDSRRSSSRLAAALHSGPFSLMSSYSVTDVVASVAQIVPLGTMNIMNIWLNSFVQSVTWLNCWWSCTKKQTFMKDKPFWTSQPDLWFQSSVALGAKCSGCRAGERVLSLVTQRFPDVGIINENCESESHRGVRMIQTNIQKI